MLNRRRVLKLAGGAAFASTLPAAPIVRGSFAQSDQTWPNRSVRLIVPFPQGGRTDAIVRVIGVKLSDIWGQQLVIENRGGGTTNIGTEAVARAEPDGYTLLLQSTPLAVNRFLFRSLPYDALTDLEPVSLLCEYPLIMTVPISSPANSVAEFIAYANANRGRITFASSGHGTSAHLSGEMFQRMARIEMLHVPYRGPGPALIDLIPGRVDVMFGSIGATLPLIRGGRLRGLAVTTTKRSAAAPQLPTIDEGGVPGFDVSSWYAVLRAGADACLNHPAIAVRRRRGARRSSHQVPAGSPWHYGDRLDSSRARRVPQIRGGQMGTADPRGRHPGRRLTRSAASSRDLLPRSIAPAMACHSACSASSPRRAGRLGRTNTAHWRDRLRPGAGRHGPRRSPRRFVHDDLVRGVPVVLAGPPQGEQRGARPAGGFGCARLRSNSASVMRHLMPTRPRTCGRQRLGRYHHRSGVNRPAACSITPPSENSVSSSNGRPISCRPSGRPCAVEPGRHRDARQARHVHRHREHVVEIHLDRIGARPSRRCRTRPTASPASGSRRRPCAKQSSKSRLISVRTFCARR